MSLSCTDLTPFRPSDKTLELSGLPNKVITLTGQSAKLAGHLSPITLSTLERYMAVINSYYSNLIEGNPTLPHDIRAAQQGDYSSDPVTRDLQLESVGHIAVQSWLREQSPDLAILFSPEFIKQIHCQFYQNIPETLWLIKDVEGKVVDKVVPGQWRTKQVKVGKHVPPEPERLNDLMRGYCDEYSSNKHQGDRKITTIMAAHHRFEWIHPFADGNGRVGRLLTDAALKAAGLDSYGAWCLSRGLAKRQSRYKELLSAADIPRQGETDGRGALTEKGLTEFCDYMLDTAIDQVSYISELLQLNSLRKRITSYIQARNDFRIPGMSDTLKQASDTILYTAFIQGELQRSEAIALCGMPDRTARRLLSQLKAEGLLSETSNKSPLRWEIPEHAEDWYFPQLAPKA